VRRVVRAAAIIYMKIIPYKTYMKKTRPTRRTAAAAAAAINKEVVQSPPSHSIKKPISAAAVAAAGEWKNINQILGRENIAAEIKQILGEFEKRREDNMFKKGIYIYGHPGSGKTQFILDILREMNFDVVKYDTGDIRNKSLIDTITEHNMSDRNVLSMMRGESRKLSILMDEIDGMNNGDKGGITALIKLIRQKKTKKQKNEDITLNPIICIGNYHTDKKIRELMKVCNTFELKKPTPAQLEELIACGYAASQQHKTPAQLEELIACGYAASQQHKTPAQLEELIACSAAAAPPPPREIAQKIAHFSQGDLRKVKMYLRIWNNSPAELMTNVEFFQMKVFNENTKKITESLIQNYYSLSDHSVYMNETDRTIVALLWHENIVDYIADKPGKFDFYQEVLDNICFSDYIDRITFQNQIWRFNEMTSLIKTFYNNLIYHNRFSGAPPPPPPPPQGEIRFTKVLTKYSTEYNNILFVYNLCQQLNMDQKDMLAFFKHLRYKCGDICGNNELLAQFERFFEKYEINKLFIKRIYRYLDKNVKRDSANDEELENDSIECGDDTAD
jgi:DNA polymerase III delta prime subunit